MRIPQLTFFYPVLPFTLTCILTVIFCLISPDVQAIAPNEGKTDTDSSPSQVSAGMQSWVGLATVQAPQTPTPASKPQFRTLTYVLLALSAAIGPIVIFFLFRQNKGKSRRRD